MKINRATLVDCEKESDTVVVIDVLRAFTTSAFAFAQGAREIALVSTVDEAFQLRDQYPDALIMGEVRGHPVDGFDFGRVHRQASNPTYISWNARRCTLASKEYCNYWFMYLLWNYKAN